MEYRTIVHEADDARRQVFYWLCGAQESENMLVQQLKKRLPDRTWTLCACHVEDWARDLSPWTVRNVDKLGDFAGEGRRTLEELIHIVQETQAETGDNAQVRCFVGGYSLAGLFALWALYETDLFDGAAACSASLWFPGWREYAAAHTLPRRSDVYLSLGRRETRTKHPLMAKIEDEIRTQTARLQSDPNAGTAAFVWNDGGHFTDSEGRMAAGFAALAEKNV